MKTFERVLVFVDEHDDSSSAIRRAHALVADEGGEITTFGVVDDGAGGHAERPRWVEIVCQVERSEGERPA